MIQRLIFLFAAALTISIVSLVSLKYTSGDFDVYYNSSHSYLNKLPIYTAHGGINEFKYSPLFALCFSPLTFMNEFSALFVWTILNIFLLYAIFYLLYKLKQISFTKIQDLLIMFSLFALTGRYIFADFRLGQVNVLLCFFMFFAVYLEINKKPFWASVALAFSLMIKFFPLLLVVYFLITRRFKLLIYTSMMIVVFLISPSIYTGWGFNLKYLHDWLVLLKSTPPIMLYSVKNNSLLSFFSWFFIARHENHYIYDYALIKKVLNPEIYYAWFGTCFIIFSLFFYDKFFVKPKDDKIPYIDYACLFVCCLLFNPLAYLNSFVLLIIPYFFTLRYLFYVQLKGRYVFLCGVIVFLSFILMILDNKIFFKNHYKFFDFIELKPLMWVSLLVYINLLVAKFSLKLKS